MPEEPTTLLHSQLCGVYFPLLLSLSNSVLGEYMETMDLIEPEAFVIYWSRYYFLGHLP